jgi:hypothetical protein
MKFFLRKQKKKKLLDLKDLKIVNITTLKP